MADAWSVEVQREPEWDDYARSEAIADLLHERRVCSRCGLMDTFETVGKPIPVAWPDGRTYAVQQHRCLACGALDLVQRDAAAENSKTEPQPGHYAPGDGLRMTVTERR